MSLTPTQVGQSLTEATIRSSRSPASSKAAPASPAITYTSFPTPQQMARDRAARGLEVTLDEETTVVVPSSVASHACLLLAPILLIGSIPTLLGRCCWPSLLAGDAAISDTTRTLAHTLTLALTSAGLFVLLACALWATRGRRRILSSRLRAYGPVALMVLASALVLVDPIRRVLLDSGSWSSGAGALFREGCGEGWTCLTPTSLTLLCVCTYAGFALLFAATLWQADLATRARLLAARWHHGRAERAAARLAAREAQLAARVDLEQAAALAMLESRASPSRLDATRRPSAPFGALHSTMRPPPVVLLRREDGGGYRFGIDSTEPEAEPSASSTHEAPPPGEYHSEGYSFELLHAPHVREAVIKVGPLLSPPKRTHGACSPTVTSSPISAVHGFVEFGGVGGGASPVSSVVRTPIDSGSYSPSALAIRTSSRPVAFSDPFIIDRCDYGGDTTTMTMIMHKSHRLDGSDAKAATAVA